MRQTWLEFMSEKQRLRETGTLEQFRMEWLQQWILSDLPIFNQQVLDAFSPKPAVSPVAEAPDDIPPMPFGQEA